MTDEQRHLQGDSLPVVIVGGGMAGLSAAWTLHRQGIPVTVLEKTEHVGGVVRSVRMNDHSTYRREDAPGYHR